jgi:hypothetical protein
MNKTLDEQIVEVDLELKELEACWDARVERDVEYARRQIESCERGRHHDGQEEDGGGDMAYVTATLSYYSYRNHLFNKLMHAYEVKNGLIRKKYRGFFPGCSLRERLRKFAGQAAWFSWCGLKYGSIMAISAMAIVFFTREAFRHLS